MLGSGTVARTGFGLLDIAPENAILVSLVILGLGSGSWLVCGSLGEELLCNSDMETAEVAWCCLRRKF